VIARHLYNTAYRFFRMPWEIGPRAELVDLVESGRLAPGRAIDLGCGTGANAVFLAQHGFTVTGVDFASAALAKARHKARLAEVAVDFVEGDLTALDPSLGTFDLLVDYGTFDDLNDADRRRYVDSVSTLARPATQFLLWCFEWQPRRRDRWLGMRTVVPGEIVTRFGARCHIERIAGSEPNPRKFIAAHAAYLMSYR
jgi:SAM-dependent methyltransferase